MKYLIITPVHNEEKYIEYTLKSVCNQTIKPVKWIIVDDNSTDRTLDIIKKYGALYPRLIELYKISKKKKKTDYSSRIVEVFYYGLSKAQYEYDILVKLDGDVRFENDFFENILNEFKKDEKLGIASGHLSKKGIPEKLRYGNINTRGATKCYRKACFVDISGLPNFISWDTLDNAAARAKGWRTRILPHYFEHLKEEGNRAGNKLINHYRSGMSNGCVPYNFIYFSLKALSKINQKPILIGTLVQFYGYFKYRFIKRIRPFPYFATKQVRKEQKEFLLKLLRIG